MNKIKWPCLAIRLLWCAAFVFAHRIPLAPELDLPPAQRGLDLSLGS
jgi:hypothetical protein